MPGNGPSTAALIATAPVASGIAAARRASTQATTTAPAITQTLNATPVQPNGASWPGSTKMPDPIIPPTTKAVAVQKPKGRVAVVSFAMGGETVTAPLRKQGAGNPDQAGDSDTSSKVPLWPISPACDDAGRWLASVGRHSSTGGRGRSVSSATSDPAARSCATALSGSTPI